jgi:hypothetical protein
MQEAVVVIEDRLASGQILVGTWLGGCHARRLGVWRAELEDGSLR